MKKILRLLSFPVILALLSACLPVVGNQPPANAVVINVTANSALAPWLDALVDEFNATQTKISSGKPVYVHLESVEAGQAVVDISSGRSAPALWIPDGSAWVAVLADKGRQSIKKIVSASQKVRW
jgi:hypothetical protein